LQTVLVNVAELVARREYPYRSEWLPHDRLQRDFRGGCRNRLAAPQADKKNFSPWKSLTAKFD